MHARALTTGGTSTGTCRHAAVPAGPAGTDRRLSVRPRQTAQGGLDILQIGPDLVDSASERVQRTDTSAVQSWAGKRARVKVRVRLHGGVCAKARDPMSASVRCGSLRGLIGRAGVAIWRWIPSETMIIVTIMIMIRISFCEVVGVVIGIGATSERARVTSERVGISVGDIDAIFALTREIGLGIGAGFGVSFGGVACTVLAWLA